MATIDSSKRAGGITVCIEDLDREWAKKKESPPWHYLTPSQLRACRAAFLMYLLQEMIPEDQRWMYYMLLLHFQQDFYNPIYVWSILMIPVLLLFPILPAGFIYGATMMLDLIWRTRTEDDAKKFQETENSPWLYIFLFSCLFYSGFDMRPLIQIVEACLGPVRVWSYVFVPLLPGLLILAEERDTINGFVPEGRRGVWTALAFQAISALLPQWCQWLFFAAFSVPDPTYPAMFVEWILYTAAWVYFGISPAVAYAAHLLINQYPHVNTWLRRQGGGPSVILQRERLGSLWFAYTSLVLQVLKVFIGPEMVGLLVLASYLIAWWNIDLPADLPYFKFITRHWSPTAGKFKHQPLKDSDGLRLLRLLPQPLFGGFQIQCDMIHATLECAPSYIAISHTWGDPSEMKEIIINGSPFPVSPNIYSLLLAKRSAWRTVVVWIDSVCINQVDDKEKSRQVALMRHIFEEASCTIGWLGDDNDGGKAFRAIKKLQSRDNKTSTVINRLWVVLAKLWSKPIADSPFIPWQELENLVSNPWFERVWIVQEIATSRNPILRYGNEEMKWNTFALTLFVLLFSDFSFAWPRSKFLGSQFWENNGLINALIMDNLRTLTSNVDFFRRKDMLKLGLRFNATYQIDKVYALLGIVEDRRTPFLHPTLSRTGSLGLTNSRAGHVVNDSMKTIKTLNKMMGNMNNFSNTREGRALVPSAEIGLRNFIALTEDLKRSLDYMKSFEEGKSNIENGPTNFQPDYSEKSTAEDVYTYVARDLIREGDLHSLFALAGIGQNRNVKLKSLPSWVPDWSTNLETYLLPRPTSPQIKGRKDAKDKEPSLRDGGPKILYLKGVVVGTVAHLSYLSKDLQQSSEDAFQQSEKDFNAHTDNYWEAWQKALTHTGLRYVTEEIVPQESGRRVVKEDTDAGKSAEEVTSREETVGKETLIEERLQAEAAKSEADGKGVREKGNNHKGVEDVGIELGEVSTKQGSKENAIEIAFWRTVMANTVNTDNRPPSKEEIMLHKDSVLGWKPTCAIQAALYPERAQDYWKEFEELKRAETAEEHETYICEEYLYIRRLQSSANSKFAHLVRNEIVPSFASYRVHFEYTTSDDGKPKAMYSRGPKPGGSIPAPTPDDSPLNRMEAAFEMFTDRNAGALSRYMEFVDYTIGRKFAITNSGFMGLVPGGTQEGDLVVWLQEEGLCLTLRPTKGSSDDGDGDVKKVGGSTGFKVEGRDNTEPNETFKFVGKAYIHELALDKLDESDREKRRFKLY